MSINKLKVTEISVASHGSYQDANPLNSLFKFKHNYIACLHSCQIKGNCFASVIRNIYLHFNLNVIEVRK